MVVIGDLPAAVRADRGAGVLAGTRHRRDRRASSGAKVRSPFDRFVEVALYEPEVGLLRVGPRRRAGPGRDFVTSPEVGSLFGACVARALDRCWHELGEPDPFVVIEAGAGNGRLARDVLRAQPACERRPALRARRGVGGAPRRAARAARARAARRGARARSRASRATTRPLPVAGPGPVFVVARRAARRSSSRAWCSPTSCSTTFRSGSRSATRRRVAGGARRARARPASSRRCSCRPTRATRARSTRSPTASPCVPGGAGCRSRVGSMRWIAACSRVLRHGTLIAIDYVDDAARAARARHRRRGCARIGPMRRGGPVLDAPGAQDITADVVREQLVHAARALGLHGRRATSRRPNGCAGSASTSSSRPAGGHGRRAPTSATSRPSPAGAGSSEASRAHRSRRASAPTAS